MNNHRGNTSNVSHREYGAEKEVDIQFSPMNFKVYGAESVEEALDIARQCVAAGIFYPVMQDGEKRYSTWMLGPELDEDGWVQAEGLKGSDIRVRLIGRLSQGEEKVIQ